MSMVRCDQCGRAVDSRGLAAHKRGAPCLVERDRRYAQEHGLVRVTGQAARILACAGVTVELLATHYYPGFVGRRTRVYYAEFAPAWAVTAYDFLRKQGYTTDGCVQLLAKGPEDPELRAVVTMALLERK